MKKKKGPVYVYNFSDFSYNALMHWLVTDQCLQFRRNRREYVAMLGEAISFVQAVYWRRPPRLVRELQMTERGVSNIAYMLFKLKRSRADMHPDEYGYLRRALSELELAADEMLRDIELIV